MFKRRMFRPRGRGLGTAIHPMLQRANELMAIGDFTGAASTYEELARRANSRNGPAAPHLFIQAGRAYIQAGQVTNGMVQIQTALKLFAGRGEWLRFKRNRRRVYEELLNMGLEKEANTLIKYMTDEFSAELETHEVESQINPKPVAKARATLPTRCEECGAPLRVDKVDWVDENTAECPYCGNLMRS